MVSNSWDLSTVVSKLHDTILSWKKNINETQLEMHCLENKTVDVVICPKLQPKCNMTTCSVLSSLFLHEGLCFTCVKFDQC